MVEFITSYTVTLKLSNSHLVGAVIGLNGLKQREIEKKHGCKLINSTEDGTITIKGNLEKDVELTKKFVVKTLEAHSFVAEIGEDLANELLGSNGEKMEEIRKMSKAHIKIGSSGSKKFKRLELVGNKQSFKLGKQKVLDVIEANIQSQFNVENAARCFRGRRIKKGIQQVKYCKGQLPPSPQICFLEFNNELLDCEEMFTEECSNRTRKPPTILSKNCAVQAPFQGNFYRAKVLGVKRDNVKDDISLTVIFVDFGNIETVSLFDCRDLEKKHLYSPLATLCQLSNIKKAKDDECLTKFRQHINDSTKNITVKVNQNEEPVKVDMATDTDGDIAQLLVDQEYAEWIDGPFDPKIESRNTCLGDTPVLYEREGHGGESSTVNITAFSKLIHDFTYTSQLESKSFLKSLDAAYACAKKILESRQNNFLSNHTLHFSVESSLKFYGESSGAALSLGILSACLKLAIPSKIAITGCILRTGEISGVEKIREKILGALEGGKTILYVHRDNLNEALESGSSSIQIKPVKNIFDIINDIWYNW